MAQTPTYYNEMTLEEVEQYIFLLYGGSGCGKTTLAAMFPSPVMFLSCDVGVMGGLLSAVSLKKESHKLFQVRLNSYAQLLGLYPNLERDFKAGVYKSLVLDSLTTLNQLIIRDILSMTAKEVPVFQDWNLATTRMRTTINKLASFGAHTIFTATEQVVKDEQVGRLMGLPNLPGKLAQEAPAGVDVVLRLHTRMSFDAQTRKRVVTYLGQTAPDEIWYAKDRSATLPPEIILSGADGKPTFQPLEHLFKPTSKGGVKK